MKDYRRFVSKPDRYNIPFLKKYSYIFATVILSLIIFTFILLGTNDANSKTKVEFIEFTVSTGDTLWAIAKEHYHSNGDIRDYIYYITKANNLTTAQIYPGQVLIIPLMD